MKRLVTIVSMLFILFLIGCGKSEYPLNGLWSGIIDGNGENIKITLAFIDDLCFLSYEVDDRTSSQRIRYNYENGSGYLRITSFEENQFFVNGNVLNFTHDDIPVVLNKDVRTKAAPSSLNGLWRDLEGWDMAVVNDRIYVSRDSTTDYGIYTFNKKEGSYTSRQYGAKVEFTLNKKVLDATINGYAQTFSRK